MKITSTSQYKNLFFTYVLSENNRAFGTIILLDGLPSNPSSKNNLIKRLSVQNYDIFFPRYEGTWESTGEFLKRSPSVSIAEFIKALKIGINIENKKYIAKKIFILGASFGGGIALDIVDKNIVDKVCAISPVISFTKVDGINTLEGYLKTEHEKDYRFNSFNWSRLLNNKIWNLEKGNIKYPNKILIVAGKNDTTVKKRDVINFSNKNKIEMSLYDFGHITVGKITEQMLKEILGFFSK